jgi:transcriptional regulator with XRE-family HTH domain
MAKLDAAIRQLEADLRVTVGNNIELARTALGKSQADLQREYPQYLTTRTKLSAWENGDALASAVFLIALCDDYGFTMDFFMRSNMDAVAPQTTHGTTLRLAEMISKRATGGIWRRGSASGTWDAAPAPETAPKVAQKRMPKRAPAKESD